MYVCGSVRQDKRRKTKKDIHPVYVHTTYSDRGSSQQHKDRSIDKAERSVLCRFAFLCAENRSNLAGSKVVGRSQTSGKSAAGVVESRRRTNAPTDEKVDSVFPCVCVRKTKIILYISN